MFKNIPKTEQLFSKTNPIDKLLDKDALKLMVNEHMKAVKEIDKVLPKLQKVVNVIYKNLLKNDKKVIKYLNETEIDKLFNLDQHFVHVDHIFDRVFD